MPMSPKQVKPKPLTKQSQWCWSEEPYVERPQKWKPGVVPAVPLRTRIDFERPLLNRPLPNGIKPEHE